MEVIKRGFELLKTRPLVDKVDINSLEEAYNVKIPFSYRLFSEVFYPNIPSEDDEKVVKYSPLINPVNDEIYFDNLFPLEVCLEGYEEFDFWNEKGFMQIGDGPPGGGILLSMTGDDEGSIVYNYADDYIILASNIFDFIRDVVLIKK